MKEDHKYDALRDLDNHDDSGTEVEEWDTAENKARPRRRRNRALSIVGWYRWVIEAILLFVVAGLLLERRKDTKSGKYEVTGDVTGFAPSFSQQITTFQPDPRFVPENASAFFLDQTARKAWLGIVPKGLGYLVMESPEKYDNLPQPIKDYPNQTVFTTSMTHQLHCLYAIMEAYSAMSIGVPAAEPWHLSHCFDYLRQGIMCAGDVALEGAETTFPRDPEWPDGMGSDGWDATHVCKDYGQIYEYLEEKRAADEKWIV